MPPSGMTNEASGVAHTMAVAATVMSEVTPKANTEWWHRMRWERYNIPLGRVRRASFLLKAGYHSGARTVYEY